MRSFWKFAIVWGVVALVTPAIGGGLVQAAEILANPGLELSAGPSGWNLVQSITGQPGTPVSAVEHLDGSNEPEPLPGELGILLKGPTGNQGAFAGQNQAVNVTLSQTVAVGASRTFTFTGHSLIQASSSAILDTLGAITPLGDYNLDAVVNAADYTIWRDTLGSTTDFRANGTNEGASLDVIDQADFEFWKDRFGDVGRLAGQPSPTQSFLKVEFLNANDVVLGTPVNIDLRSDPTTEAWRTHTQAGFVSPVGTTKARVSAVITNMVDSATPGAGQDLSFDNFSLNQTSIPFAGEKLVNGNLNTLGAPDAWVIEKTSEDNLSFSGAAAFAANSGSVGMWLRSFNGGDAKLLQTLPAVAGADYDFSAFSKWETGYNGADPLSSTQTFMTIEYLNAVNAVLGMQSLDLRTVQLNDGLWRELTLDGGTAPANTAFVRISVGATGMANSLINPQSAFFDDFSLIETLPGAGSLTAVPEPGTVWLLGIALGMIGAGRRKS